MANEKMSLALDLRGLDLVTPVDLMKDGHSPSAKNFRLYAQQADDRRVAISSRKGPGYYITPLAETLSDSNTGSVSPSTAQVGIITGIHAQPFTGTSTDRITRIDLNVSNPDGATGPLLVQLYSGDSIPDTLLAESSILGGSIGPTASYQTARFVNAVKTVNGKLYWIVVRQQDDATGMYTLHTSTTATSAWKSDSTLSQLTGQSYSLQYKVFTAVDGTDKGAYRFNRDNGQNTTVVVYGTTLYKVDETTHALVKIVDGLSANATEYAFTNADNKVFWVNGYDQLTNWNGTDEVTAGNMVTNGTFEVNTIGWVGAGSTVIARSTSTFNSGVASLSVTGSGNRIADTTVSMKAGHRYRLNVALRSSAGTQTISAQTHDGVTVATISTDSNTTSWASRTIYFTPTIDNTTLRFVCGTSDFFIDDVKVIDTGIEYITDTELPILSDITFHKDRAWGRVASDPNKLVFSENPGNPSNLAVNKQWYYQWLSVSFTYVPRPHNGSPITWFGSFQDSLIVMTQDKKYVISGYDRGSLNLRESTGSKGALSKRNVIAEENAIYFASTDGFYEFNGSQDKKISERINPLYDACGFKENITPALWRNQVRFYMASQGSPVNDICTIYDKDLKEMMLDTGTYVNRALFYNDADDNGELIEFSSLTPVAYNAEQNYHSAGAPIDFEYRFKYDSLGMPGQKKRIKRFIPLLQGVDSTFKIQLAMDKDFQDSPRVKDVLMSTNGAKLGAFKFGDGTLFGGNKSFKRIKQAYSGYASYWQMRVMRKGVNNRVAFIGAQFSYKAKRI